MKNKINVSTTEDSKEDEQAIQNNISQNSASHDSAKIQQLEI